MTLAGRAYHLVGPVNLTFAGLFLVNAFVYWKVNRSSGKWYSNSFFQTYRNTNSIFETKK